MKRAIYPGSFDPITNGHLEIINRASKLFDKIYVLISVNTKKNYVFSDNERKEMVSKVCKDFDNVEVVLSDDLVINYAKKVGANVIIRGLRSHVDFDDEMSLFHFNKQIDSDVETIFLFSSLENLFLSSSAIKELVLFDSPIDNYVPSCIKDEIQNKIKSRLTK